MGWLTAKKDTKKDRIGQRDIAISAIRSAKLNLDRARQEKDSFNSLFYTFYGVSIIIDNADIIREYVKRMNSARRLFSEIETLTEGLRRNPDVFANRKPGEEITLHNIYIKPAGDNAKSISDWIEYSRTEDKEIYASVVGRARKFCFYFENIRTYLDNLYDLAIKI